MIESDITESDALPEARLKKFEPAEMIACEDCRRPNPPTRSNCLYCAAILPRATVDPASVASVEGPAFATEQINETDEACYLVLASASSGALAELPLAEIAQLLQLEPRQVEIALSLGRPVPLARLESVAAAELLAGKMRGLGIKGHCLREDTLDLHPTIEKVRALGISADGLIVYSVNGEEISVSWADLILMVQGRVEINRVEVQAKRRRRGADPLDTREIFADEPLLDFYLARDAVGWRISAAGFDFSCLGAEKTFTVFENFSRLIKVLRMHAQNAEADNSFQRLGPVLAKVWPAAPGNTKRERRRTIRGKVDATITETTNQAQFNNYSRLRYRLSLLEREGGR